AHLNRIPGSVVRVLGGAEVTLHLGQPAVEVGAPAHVVGHALAGRPLWTVRSYGLDPAAGATFVEDDPAVCVGTPHLVAAGIEDRHAAPAIGAVDANPVVGQVEHG